MFKQCRRVLTVGFAALLLFAGTSPAFAQEAVGGADELTTVVDEQECPTAPFSFSGADGIERSFVQQATDDFVGVQAELIPGDYLNVEDRGSKVAWYQADGTKIFEFVNPQYNYVDSTFLVDGDTITVKVPDDLANRPVPLGACSLADIISMGWNIAWSGLVCTPVGLIPGAGIAAGFACSAAGTAISTFVPWDVVC